MKLGLYVLVTSLLIPSLLFSQDDSTASSTKKYEVFVSGGFSFPYLPTQFDDNCKNGTKVGAGVGYRLEPGSAGYSKVYAAFEYNLFKFSEQDFLNAADTNILKANPGLTATQRPVKIFTASVNYQGTFTAVSEVISPYFLLGVGLMYMSVPPLYTDPTTTLAEDAYNRFTLCWSAGLGVDVPIGDTFGAFVQGRSVIGVLSDTRQYFPVELGVRYTLP